MKFGMSRIISCTSSLAHERICVHKRLDFLFFSTFFTLGSSILLISNLNGDL
jgi:hypothetical protein